MLDRLDDGLSASAQAALLELPEEERALIDAILAAEREDLEDRP